jgi:hypothetical protein
VASARRRRYTDLLGEGEREKAIECGYRGLKVDCRSGAGFDDGKFLNVREQPAGLSKAAADVGREVGELAAVGCVCRALARPSLKFD